MRRSLPDVCDKMPRLFNDYRGIRPEFIEPLVTQLLKVICAGAVETLGVERTMQLFDRQRAILAGANVVRLRPDLDGN